MKKIVFLLAAFCFTLECYSQTTKMLQSNMWYCVGDWENHKHILMTVSNHSKYDSEVKFLPSGKLVRISADEKKADSSYTYSVKKGIMKVDKTASASASEPKISFYKLNLLEYNKIYELIPKTEAEVKELEKQE